MSFDEMGADVATRFGQLIAAPGR